MFMKTGIFTPNFYLARKGQVIKINTVTKIGRTQGDIILEDDELLSNLHCEITPTLLSVTIRDLDSTNGVYVNKQKIFPNTDVKLNVGDEVKLGRDSYILCDNDKEVKKIDPPRDRRKHPRAENLYSLENLVNFYSAQWMFRFIYLFVLIAGITSTFLNVHLDLPVPAELQILTKLYNDQIIFSGLKVIFIIYGLSLLHGLALHFYFNRNPLRKIFSLVVYFIAVFMLVDFKHGPLSGVKSYLTARTSIEQMKPDEKGIIQLKTLVHHKDLLTKGYKFTRSKLNEEDQKTLEKDYKTMVKKVSDKISSVYVKKQ